MPNTDAQVLRAKNAVALIAKKYQTYLMGNSELLLLLGTPSVEKFSTTIKFMDAAPFRTNLATATLRGRQKAGCVTNGFTTWIER